MFGTYRQFGVSKFFLRFVKNKEEFEKSLNQVFTYDFENIILAHGENVQGGGKALLKAALLRRKYGR